VGGGGGAARAGLVSYGRLGGCVLVGWSIHQRVVRSGQWGQQFGPICWTGLVGRLYGMVESVGVV
jgi:uncharacterized membrane protein